MVCNQASDAIRCQTDPCCSPSQESYTWPLTSGFIGLGKSRNSCNGLGRHMGGFFRVVILMCYNSGHCAEPPATTGRLMPESPYWAVAAKECLATPQSISVHIMGTVGFLLNQRCLYDLTETCPEAHYRFVLPSSGPVLDIATK